MIMGLTGRMAAGKGTVADLLKARGFVYHSLSDVIRSVARERGLESSRANLTVIGNELRGEGGPSVLADRVLGWLEEGSDYVIDSVRNPAEVEALARGRADFVMVCVDAPAAVRFERLTARGRLGDVQTLEEFEAQEARELHTDDPTTQQLLATEAKATHRIDNSGGLEALKRAVDSLLGTLS